MKRRIIRNLVLCCTVLLFSLQVLADEAEKQMENYLELGISNHYSTQVVSIGGLSKGDNFHAYVSIGFPTLLNVGFAWALNTDGTGINARVGVIGGSIGGWSSSISYGFSPEKNKILFLGMGYVSTFKGLGINGGDFARDMQFAFFYPVISLMHKWR
ncbi:MAG: hypothetical protein OEZ43_07720 [Gammaproteobacteria bacterium]|nr:hypothetical protein [Gammaproteobacteria bacterium]